MESAVADTGSGLRTMVFVGPAQTFESGNGTFSPTTSTLITGERDAVLVDAQHIRADVAALGDMIAATGKRLTTIFVTHGHADHWYGIEALVRRFPSAKPVATAGVVEYIEESKALASRQWRGMFGQRVVDANVPPEAVSGSIELEGHELPIIEVGQGDIAPSTVLHAPSIDAVVAGDVVYNKIHMMLGLSSPEEWPLWIDSIDQIERLEPKILVAGHKRPELPDTDVQRMLDESRAYIRAFAEESARAGDAEALVGAMSARFPDFGNLWTLHFSARSFFEKRSN